MNSELLAVVTGSLSCPKEKNTLIINHALPWTGEER